jgi:hypothetical protein
MHYWKSLVLSATLATAVGAFALAPLSSPSSPAAAAPQISVGVNLGVPPGCPYGYFDYAPYDCAPYGYYGPDWFTGGVFIGAGPWFHAPRPGWFGHVDNRYDPRNGYHGPLPARGAQPFSHFQGNEARDGQGHVGNAGHEPANEHSAGFSGRSAPRGGGRPR